MRWCTARLKDTPREKYLREIRKDYDVKEYIGIAADEGYRLERKRNRQEGHVHPLVEWGMTEADCLKYCYGSPVSQNKMQSIRIPRSIIPRSMAVESFPPENDTTWYSGLSIIPV